MPERPAAGPGASAIGLDRVQRVRQSTGRRAPARARRKARPSPIRPASAPSANSQSRPSCSNRVGSTQRARSSKQRPFQLPAVREIGGAGRARRRRGCCSRAAARSRRRARRQGIGEVPGPLQHGRERAAACRRAAELARRRSRPCRSHRDRPRRRGHGGPSSLDDERIGIEDLRIDRQRRISGEIEGARDRRDVVPAQRDVPVARGRGPRRSGASAAPPAGAPRASSWRERLKAAAGPLAAGRGAARRAPGQGPKQQRLDPGERLPAGREPAAVPDRRIGGGEDRSHPRRCRSTGIRPAAAGRAGP